ncbi:hypothetical protein FRC06_006696 [Ceratobasidium sp. 370]|nr:hypothetical protein FRC06_006696 [Ceratobasidium sp. 370]
MILDLPPELLYTIFYALDDSAQRNFVATCSVLRHNWLTEAWRCLTLTGRNVKSQLNRLITWTRNDPTGARERTKDTHVLFIRACLLNDDVSAELEGHDNTNIFDGDIYPLLDWLRDSLKILSIDLPPTPDRQFFDITLNSISDLSNLERLFLGRVKVDDGYEVSCTYTGLKEATMIWCHGIVEQRLLIDQPQLEHLDVHDSWDIGNLSLISHQWHNLKSFRFSAIDPAYAVRILENGSGAMTSLQDVSLEVPMSEFVFLTIVAHLADYPIRRFHLALSAEGLGVFLVNPNGLNKVPERFSPEWLRVIGTNLKHLEELVLDYRSGGVLLDLVWPGEPSTYANALSSAERLHTLAISIHAIPQTGRSACRDIAHDYMQRIPSLREVHFPAMPIFPPHMFRSFSDRSQPVPETCHVGYSLFRLSGEDYHSPPDGDCYRPFWITHGTDVALDRHRRAGGLHIVASESDDLEDIDPGFFEEPDLGDHDIFDQEDLDLALWFPDGDEGSDSEMEHLELQHPVGTPDDWMDQLIIGMSNVGVAQLDLSVLDGHDSDVDTMDEHDDDMHLAEDFSW